MMQGNDSFRLIVRRGPQPNQTYDLNKDIITLGRDITNDIVINDPEVSRHHMRMTRGAGGYTIEDLGSTNGTFVNGQRLTGARPMRPGDMIGLGETVTLAYEAAAAPVMPGAEVSGSTVPNMPQQRPPQQYQAPAAPQPQPYSYSPQPATQMGGPPQYSPAAAPVPPQTPSPGAGYGDYDPYAVREEEPRSTARWIIIGCVGLSLFCCCSSVIGLVAVDQLCLWERLPVVYDLLRALGYVATC
jgi:pSer/pThr/pTyr-binding forkhead associated (FHA) protein